MHVCAGVGIFDTTQGSVEFGTKSLRSSLVRDVASGGHCDAPSSGGVGLGQITPPVLYSLAGAEDGGGRGECGCGGP
jgi:hypothetical protein